MTHDYRLALQLFTRYRDGDPISLSESALMNEAIENALCIAIVKTFETQMANRQKARDDL